MTPRRPLPEELEPLTALWERRWHEAHAAIVPPGLTAARTRADFAARMREFAGDLWVIGPEGAPQGFVALKGHHIDQLYIDAALQGTGAARILLTHGEQMLAGRGHAQAELWCATGNARAAAFYSKCGWQLRTTETVMLDSTTGPIALDCFIFEKALA